MGDVQDILGLPRQGKSVLDVKEPKAKEAKPERPKGVSREAYNLLYGDHPIAPANLLKEIEKSKAEAAKPAVPSSVQVTYQFMEFDHEGRTDGLKLKHWTRCFKDAAGRVRPADEGEYPYAKYNRAVTVYRYDDVEYETILRPTEPITGWSKEETDYLLDLCERLDLRFIVIADRWEFPGGPRRSVEDLKERYYSIAHQLLLARGGGQEFVANNPLIRQKFEAQKERERKALLKMLLMKSQAEAEEEDAVLKEAELILQRRKAQAEAKRTEGAPLAHPGSFTNSTTELPFFDKHLIPIAPPKSGVFMRRAIVEDSIKRLIMEHGVTQAQGGARTQKGLESVLIDLCKVKAPPAAMTRAVSGMWLALHSEALMLVNIRQRRDKLGIQPDDGTRGKRPLKTKASRGGEDGGGGGGMPAGGGAPAKRQRTGK